MPTPKKKTEVQQKWHWATIHGPRIRLACEDAVAAARAAVAATLGEHPHWQIIEIAASEAGISEAEALIVNIAAQYGLPVGGIVPPVDSEDADFPEEPVDEEEDDSNDADARAAYEADKAEFAADRARAAAAAAAAAPSAAASHRVIIGNWDSKTEELLWNSHRMTAAELRVAAITATVVFYDQVGRQWYAVGATAIMPVELNSSLFDGVSQVSISPVNVLADAATSAAVRALLHTLWQMRPPTMFQFDMDGEEDAETDEPEVLVNEFIQTSIPALYSRLKRGDLLVNSATGGYRAQGMYAVVNNDAPKVGSLDYDWDDYGCLPLSLCDLPVGYHAFIGGFDDSGEEGFGDVDVTFSDRPYCGANWHGDHYPVDLPEAVQIGTTDDGYTRYSYQTRIVELAPNSTFSCGYLFQNPDRDNALTEL